MSLTVTVPLPGFRIKGGLNSRVMWYNVVGGTGVLSALHPPDHNTPLE